MPNLQPVQAPALSPRAAPANSELDGHRAALAALPADARPLKVAKARLAKAEAVIRQHFDETRRGADVVLIRPHVLDEIIQGLWDWAQERRYPLVTPSAGERLAVVAVGGFGRGELAPHSDIDLLFLYPYAQTSRSEKTVETILYTLWDLGFTVGYASRSVDEALAATRGDTTILTADLETRLIIGDQALYDAFKNRLRSQVLAGRGPTYLQQKLDERRERHERAGDSRYILEPNVKDGEGGLRDLQLIVWLARFFYDTQRIEDLVHHNMLDARELQTYRTAQSFLWAVRCHLHYLTGRAEERLTFDLQMEVGERMGYRARHRLDGVERFMKRFYLVAKEVAVLTETVAGTLRDEHRSARRLALPSLRRGRRLLDGVVLRDGHIDVDDPERFTKNPVDILKLFQLADAHDATIRPHALRGAKRGVRAITAEVRDRAEAQELIVGLITASKRASRTLGGLNAIGALGRFVPEFRRIVALMEHNLYHAYTADKHTLRVIGQLDAIAAGELVQELPACTEALQHIASKADLYLAAFFHDAGKGSKGNHAAVGEQLATRALERWGQPGERIETVAWLVRHHLLMTSTAFSRDLEDPKTVQDFVQVVQSPERLRLLLLLTVADIRAVSPTSWNGWKAQLLRALFRAAENAMLAGDVVQTRRHMVAEAKDQLRAQLLAAPPPGWGEEAIEAYLRRHDPRYWLGFGTTEHDLHARLIARVENHEELSGLQLTIDRVNDRTELVLYAPDHPGLFMEVAGALALAGASILDARIFTTTDSMALDSFGLQDAVTGGAVDEPRRLERIRKTVTDAIAGRIHLARALAERGPPPARTDVFKVTPRVLIDNGASRTHTVVEINGRDRPGLLFDLTRVLRDLGLVISSAHITTFGERAVDTIYLKDVFGMKLTTPAKLEKLRTSLLAVLEPPSAGDGRADHP